MGICVRRSIWPALIVAVLAETLITAGCSREADSTDGAAGSQKRIVLGLSFPCGLNEYSTLLCKGARDAGSKLSEGYSFDIKTGVNYSDNVAFNNILQTLLQQDPAGFIVFPAGPAAQTPVLNQACDKGVKVVIIDSPADGVKCQVNFIGADHYQLGASVGQWLVDHPSASKEVGIVTQPPGQYASTDARVKGFTDAVEKAGFEVVATVTTDLSLDRTRTVVTNMVTAHPNLGAVFSANGPIGQGTAQALKGNSEIIQLSQDGFVSDVKLIQDGEVAANAAQNPYQMGQLAVQYMVDALEGKDVPAKKYTTSMVVDKSNAQEYIAAGGMH
ncbi:hypothetical protein FDG2_3765 [Candidatus Protofrankia californiensis]|uniref:Periplasmic binding protein domain-containing protein n=1 Tax=Candidatus Protofrankia californiensis TaxID=1839754 RepID=A0A1C3P0R5_9ACTN|nr:hypothetical protein FDG2_3765 [Candidatus Protofrankia californiensis]